MFFTQPGKAKSTLIGLGAFAIIMVIAYALGSTEPLPGATEEISTGAMKFIDGGLLASYIFLGIAFIGIIISEVSSFFR
ncbi:MAG: hypothetical protein HC905_23630 [Bacteroidales bacterium]|nr:hypothetical protein [Bacteroidales bacterium]